jgi:hypothetical protein
MTFVVSRPAESGDDSWVLWSTFEDKFSGSMKFLHRCIPDPLEPTRYIPMEDEMLQRVDTLLCEVEESLLLLIEKQIDALDDMICIKQSRDDSREREAGLRIKAIEESRKVESQKLKQANLAFSLLCRTDSSIVRNEYAHSLASSGGLLGYVNDEVLGKKLPVLLGCFYLDDGSVTEIQCLGVAHVGPGLSEAKVLGCSILDPLTGRIVPATLGGRMRDVGSGEIVPINGVGRDENSNVVIPYSNLRGIKSLSKETTLDRVIKAPGVLETLLSLMRSTTRSSGELRFDTSPVADDGNGRLSHSVGAEVQLPVDHQARRASTPPQSVEHHVLRNTGGTVFQNPTTVRRRSSYNPTDLDKSFEKSLDTIFYGNEESDAQELLQKIKNEFLSKSRQFQGDMEIKVKVLNAKQEELVQQVNLSDLDTEQKDRLLADMERQKLLMDQIVAQEHSRQLVAFQRSLIESAERRKRRMEIQRAQFKELQETAGTKGVSVSDHASHRIQTDTYNALEDQIGLELTTAAYKRLEEIAKEQEDVLEALAACAGSSNSAELEDKILGQYEADVDKIEAVIRHNLSDHVSQISADTESELARKLVRLKIAADKARSKRRWSKVRTFVRTGFLTSSRNIQSNRDMILLRHTEQLATLDIALEEQQKLERSALLAAQDVLSKRLISEADARLSEKLKSVNDDLLRSQLLSAHASELEALRHRINLDNERQLEALDAQLKARKKAKVKDWQDQAQRELDVSTMGNNEEVSRQSILVQMIADQETQKSQLLGALVLQDQLEKHNLEQTLADATERQLAESDVEMLSKLQKVNDVEMRVELMNQHETDRNALRSKLDIDMRRQLEELQSRLDERRSLKLDRELQKMHSQQLSLLSTKGNCSELEACNLQIEAIARQEMQKAKLDAALSESAKADRQELSRECSVSRDLALAQSELKIVENLESKGDAERNAILKSFESHLELMKKSAELDRLRQLEALNQKLADRRKQKIENEQASMHRQELELLSNLEKSRESELVALKIDVMLQHEIDAAQLSAAAVDHSTADIQILEAHQSAQQQAAIAATKAKFLKDCSGLDESERERLLNLHQVELMRLKAQGAMALANAEESLQLQLANRKSKKSAALREKQDKSLQLLLGADDRAAVMKGLELIKAENMIEIEFEKKAASAVQNIISESHLEVKLLREDFKQKAEQVIQNAEHKLLEELAALEGSTSDADKLRRAALLKVNTLASILDEVRYF